MNSNYNERLRLNRDRGLNGKPRINPKIKLPVEKYNVRGHQMAKTFIIIIITIVYVQFTSRYALQQVADFLYLVPLL